MTRQQSAPERRAQLLDAAIAVAADRGLPAMRIDDVGRAAGLSKGAVYWHFRNKQALVEGVCDHLIRLEWSCWDDLPVANPGTALRAAAGALETRFGGTDAIARVRRLALGDPVFHARRTPMKRDLHTLIAMLLGVGRPSMASATACEQASLVLAVLEGGLLGPTVDTGRLATFSHAVSLLGC